MIRQISLFLCLLVILPCQGTAGVTASPRNDSSFVLMCLSAHPDDEDGATLAYYRKIRGATAYSLFFTRGEGGQNEIGSELYGDLGVLRTQETMRAAKILGSTAYFLGFPDFGFSKTAKETFAKWGGRDSVLARLVYFIRALKPDVIITNHDTATIPGRRQHGNHQVVGIVAYEAFDKAADPSYHPEQLRDGITTWQVHKLYNRLFRQDTTLLSQPPVEIDGSAVDSAGVTMDYTAVRALAEHRSQGMDKISLSSIPSFFRRHRYILLRSDQRYPSDQHDLFSGIPRSRRPALESPPPPPEIPLLSLEVSPECLPVALHGERLPLATASLRRFIVTIVNRSGAACQATLGVTSGPHRLMEKSYLLPPDGLRDTLLMSVDEKGKSNPPPLNFRIKASMQGSAAADSFLVFFKPLAALISPDITVGLLKTYDNTLEETLDAFGIRYTLIDSATLAAGTLGGFSSIVLDIRTYEYRTDAVKYSAHLLDYVRKGGNLICSYHKTGDWNGRGYAPYPLTLTSERVTEEDAPVTVLRSNPILTVPNLIRPHDWDGWVQERSIYLPSDDTLQTSPKYERILAMSDEGEHQPPTSLLWCRYGEGSYTYVSLGLYRQLRILNPAAVKLFFNLISQRGHQSRGK